MVPSPLPGVAANTIAQAPPPVEASCAGPAMSTGGGVGAGRAAGWTAGAGGGGGSFVVEVMTPPQPASAAAAPIASHRTRVIAPRNSSHRRDHELGAFLGARGPARRHGLGLGVEAHRVRPVLVEVAEAGTLPAAEGVIRKWHGNREVDAHHADVDARGEVARRVAVAGEDGDAVAVFVLGGKPQRILVILRPHHREHRPENLLLVDAHGRLDLVKQTAAHEIAVLIALQVEAAAVDRELGALLYAEIDVVFDLVQ